MKVSTARLSRALTALALLSLLVSACSGNAYGPAPVATTAPAYGSNTAPVGKTASIEMRNFTFNPPTLQVTVGTKVTWTNMDSVGHTTTSDTGVWDGGPLSNGASFAYTFSQPGTYPYYCKPHGGPGGRGMSGTITVVP